MCYIPSWRLDQVPSLAWTSYKEGSSPLVSGRLGQVLHYHCHRVACSLLAHTNKMGRERESAHSDSEIHLTRVRASFVITVCRELKKYPSRHVSLIYSALLSVSESGCIYHHRSSSFSFRRGGLPRKPVEAKSVVALKYKKACASPSPSGSKANRPNSYSPSHRSTTPSSALATP